MSVENKNILTREYILSPERIQKSGLSVIQAEFMFNTLISVFGEIVIPRGSYIKGDANIDFPITWALIDHSAESYKQLYELCIELDICKSILNIEGIYKRLKTPASYSGARAEIHIGSWVNTKNTDVSYLVPNSKQSSTDIRLIISGQEYFIEIKGSEATDFEIGLNMFEGWLRSRLIEVFPKDNKKRIVKIGGYWIDAIGAACSIKPSVENAPWAFHSVIMSLTTQLAYNISNSLDPAHNILITKESEVDIQIVDQLKNDELAVEIELPNAFRISLIGNIVKKLTDPRTINQIKGKEVILAFYLGKRVDELLARTIIGNLLLQVPPLRNNLLGVALFDDETKKPIIIGGYKYDDQEWNSKASSIIREVFNKPNYLNYC